MLKSHEDLKVWQESISLVTQIYALTDRFPKSELYGLINQIRRSAVSIPSNIAEGAARNSQKDFSRFLYIAFGSLSELETQLIISSNLNFIDEESLKKLKAKIKFIRTMLSGLINSLSEKKS